MDLMPNQTIRILSGPDAGLYRIVLDEISIKKTVVVRLDSPFSDPRRGGRKKKKATKRPRKKAAPPLIGELIWMDRPDLEQLDNDGQLKIVQIDPDAPDPAHPDSARSSLLFERRKKVAAGFLDFDNMREQILIHRNISGLTRQAVSTTGASKALVHKSFALLCRFGFYESSLRLRWDRCGAPGILRPCDSGGRKKSGAKTTGQRIAREFGVIVPPSQPGLSTDWREKILAADAGIPTPKPPMSQRVTLIIDSHFVNRYKYEDGSLVRVDPQIGECPNRRQIARALEKHKSRLLRLLDRTTQSNFDLNLRGLVARNWKGVGGPGHTWAIDSTIGDVYLRSNVNRAWIIGRPIVYVIVDVWSTAVVGFYVCLVGPSWEMAKVSLFCSAADPTLIADLWGYQPVLALKPAPTLCHTLMCDHGEYLSKGASETAYKLIPCMSYVPPYRGDLKGLVEVLHRIEKDRQYHFTPGAIDFRRQEYELRRFNPEDSVLTVRNYTHFLHAVFTEYNLSADRRHRVDAHMQGRVFPSPAGLWHYGHEVGIGFRRAIPQYELITTLLPQAEGRVTRSGVMLGGLQYESDVINEEKWTANARNFGGWDISAHYFPGSVSRIWTPSAGNQGLLDLRISDQARASAELTFDEVADSFMFGKLNLAEVEHERLRHALAAKRRLEEIVSNASKLTAEAIEGDNGPKPTMTQARSIEKAIPQNHSKSPDTPESIPRNDAAMTAHVEMMKSVLSAANYS